jgi:hypothetical protein
MAENDIQLRQQIDTLRADVVERNQHIRKLQQWVNDLHSGMYINCVYCGHRCGPKDEVPASMADVLKKHIEECPEHPLSHAKKRIAGLETVQEALCVKIELLEAEKQLHENLAENANKVLQQLLKWIENPKHGTCAFCGERGNVEPEAMEAHAEKCEKHPLHRHIQAAKRAWFLLDEIAVLISATQHPAFYPTVDDKIEEAMKLLPKPTPEECKAMRLERGGKA